MAVMTSRPRAADPDDPGENFVGRANGGAAVPASPDGVHRRPDRYWLRAVDQPAFVR